MTYDSYDWGWDEGYRAGKRTERRQSMLGIERRDQILANQARTINSLNDDVRKLRSKEAELLAKNSELLGSVARLAQENHTLAARLGEIATATPLLGAYPVKKLGKNLKPGHQPRPKAPKVGDWIAFESEAGRNLIFSVAAVTDNGHRITIRSANSGKWYFLPEEWSLL